MSLLYGANIDCESKMEVKIYNLVKVDGSKIVETF